MVSETRTALGEGPVWDTRTSQLVWVDIPANAVHLLDPATSAERVIRTPQSVTAALPRESGGLLIVVQSGFAALSLETEEFEMIAPVEPDEPLTRMNDAACDRRGRCFAGTTSLDDAPGRGSLYRLDPDGAVERLLRDVTESNGIGWSGDDATMYYIDSGEHAIQAFDYDIARGSIANHRHLCQTPPEWGIPDGLVVDAEDGVWVGFWGGSAIRRFDHRTGELIHVVIVPVKRVTKGAFGGDGFTDLYITTAREPDEPPGSPAGALFCANPGVAGVESPRFAG